MNYLDEYNQLKELLQESSNPTNSTQLETFKWLHSVWIEEAESVLGMYYRIVSLLLGLGEVPEELESFPDTFKKDKQELYKKLLSFE